MQLELPENLHKHIQRLSAEGDALAESLAYESAIAKYNEAWKLVPDPKTDWEASTWLLAAIGDACFLSGYFTSGIEAIEYSLHCPGGAGNPFLHLRLGQCLFEKGQLASAADHLCRAYAIEGKVIFENDDQKYFEFLKTKIEKPVSGGW